MIKKEQTIGIETQQKAYEVDVRNIEPLERAGGNIRTDYGEINDLAISIAQNGILVPIRAHRKVGEEGKWVAIDGHRRLTAAMLIYEHGVKDEDGRVVAAKGTIIRARIISVNVQKISDEQLIYEMVITNSGKQLTPMELAEAVRRLTVHGVDAKEIALRFGKSKGTIDNYVLLSNAPRRIKDHINAERVNYGVALELLHAHGDWEKALEVIDSNLKVAKENAIQKAKSKAGSASNEIDEQEVAKGAKVTRGLLKTTSTKLDSFKEVMRLVTKFDSGEISVIDGQHETLTLLRDIVYNKITFKQLTDKFFAE